MSGVNNATGQTFANVDAILKDVYLGPVREQLEYASWFSYRIQKDTESISGRQVIIPLHTQRNESFAGVDDGGWLPDPGAQGWTTTKFGVKYTYGRLLLTGPTIAATKTDRGAFLRALDAAVKGLTRDTKKEMNRVYHGNGTGILNATLTTPASGTVSTFDVSNTWDPSSSKKVQFLRHGMTVALVPTTATSADQSSTNVIGAGVISTVDPDAATANVTFQSSYAIGSDTGFDASTSYYLVRASRLESGNKTATYKNTSWFKEPMGLKGMVDDGNPTGASAFQGIDATDAANSFWRATVDSTTTNLSFAAIQSMLDKIAQKGEGVAPTCMCTTYGLRTKYYELWGANDTGAEAARRFTNTMTLDGGFKAVSFNDIPIFVDVDATPGHWYFLHEPSVAQFMEEDYFWMQRDGKILHRLEDKDAYQATLCRYGENGVYRRNECGVMDNLTDV